MNKGIAFILLLMTFLFSVNAQKKNIYFQHITPQEGLSQGHVLCMIQDKEGYLWIGTYYGLNRYNGYSFKLFSNSKKDTTSLTNDVVYSLFEDIDGYIWVGTVYGLDRFDKKTETFKHFRVNTGNNCLNNGYIHSIVQDKDKNIWVATHGGGINRIDYRTNKISYIIKQDTTHQMMPSNTINDICYGRDHKLWIAADSGGLSYLNLWNNKIYAFPYNTRDRIIKKIYCLYADKKGTIWIGDSEGRIFNADTKNNNLVFHNFLPPEYKSKQYKITDIIEDSKGNILIGTDGAGLVEYNPQTRESEAYIHNVYNLKSIGSNEVRSLMVDHSGTVFAGTYGRGISKYSPYNNKFETHFVQPGMSATGDNNSFTDCVMDSHGHLITGTYSGFIVFDTATWSYKQYLPGNNYANNKILTIAIAPDNTIWMGSNRSVHRYDANLNKIHSYQLLNDGADHPVYSIKFDHLNNLWLGLFVDEGLFKIPEKEWINRSKNTFHYKKYKNTWGDSTTIGGNQIWSIIEDKNKKLWIGNNQNISTYNAKSDNFNQLYFTNLSKSLLFDSFGNLWVASRGDGLFFYNTKTKATKHYTSANGLSQNFVFGAIIDKNKNLWLTTEIGLSKFNPKTEVFRNYDTDDGLPSNRFDDRSEKMLPNGKVYMGTSNGFIIFKPEDIKDDTSNAPVIITNIKISDTPLQYSFLLGEKNRIPCPVGRLTKIVLQPSESKDLFIEFAAMHYSGPLKNRYKYRLDGFDKNWIYTDAMHRSARYTNLAEGTYFFKVLATNGDGVWNKTPMVLKITVIPHFYKSKYFLIFSPILFLFILFFIFQWRLNREIKRRKTLTLLVDDRTAEITEKNQMLEKNAESLSFTNKLLQERQQFIEEQKEEIAAQRDKLIQLNGTKDKLFSIIAHDLKNPFNILLGFSGLLLQNYHKYDDARKKNIIGMLHQSANTAHLLLDNLLNWSRSQSGNIIFDPTLTSPEEIINSTLPQVKNFATNKNITLKTNSTSENTPLFADVNMINTVLRNLILNAIKFSKKNSVIFIDHFLEGNQIKFCVKDEGIGMNQETLECLFQLDKTISKSGTLGEKGTGLGLVICKEFVEKHSGRIWAESEEGKGSSFIFTIPIEQILTK